MWQGVQDFSISCRPSCADAIAAKRRKPSRIPMHIVPHENLCEAWRHRLDGLQLTLYRCTCTTALLLHVHRAGSIRRHRPSKTELPSSGLSCKAMSHWPPSRRDLLALAFSSLPPMHAAPAAAHLASGVKIGEITPNFVRIWTRRTRDALRNAGGIEPTRTEAHPLGLGYDLTRLQGACP